VPRYRVIISSPDRKPFRVMFTANSDDECVEKFRQCLQPGMSVEIWRPDRKAFVAKIESPTSDIEA